MQYTIIDLDTNIEKPASRDLCAAIHKYVAMDEIYQNMSDNDLDKESIGNKAWELQMDAIELLHAEVSFGEIKGHTEITTEL